MYESSLTLTNSFLNQKNKKALELAGKKCQLKNENDNLICIDGFYEIGYSS
jgi:hypothetical protein